MTYETAIRKYFASFDGTEKEFSQMEHLFDALYHEKFNLTFKDGKTLSRDATKEMQATYLAKGSKIKIIHLQKIGLDCINIEFHVENEEEKLTIRSVHSIEDGKLVRAQVVDSFGSILKAKCGNGFRVNGVMARYQTNM